MPKSKQPRVRSQHPLIHIAGKNVHFFYRFIIIIKKPKSDSIRICDTVFLVYFLSFLSLYHIAFCCCLVFSFLSYLSQFRSAYQSANRVRLRPLSRLGKNPVFFLNPAQWFFWFFAVFWFFMVFLYICPEERVFRVFSVSRTLLGESRL
jgi:hypothetical protein